MKEKEKGACINSATHHFWYQISAAALIIVRKIVPKIGFFFRRDPQYLGTALNGLSIVNVT